MKCILLREVHSIAFIPEHPKPSQCQFWLDASDKKLPLLERITTLSRLPKGTFIISKSQDADDVSQVGDLAAFAIQLHSPGVLVL